MLLARHDMRDDRPIAASNGEILPVRHLPTREPTWTRRPREFSFGDELQASLKSLFVWGGLVSLELSLNSS